MLREATGRGARRADRRAAQRGTGSGTPRRRKPFDSARSSPAGRGVPVGTMGLGWDAEAQRSSSNCSRSATPSSTPRSSTTPRRTRRRAGVPDPESAQEFAARSHRVISAAGRRALLRRTAGPRVICACRNRRVRDRGRGLRPGTISTRDRGQTVVRARAPRRPAARDLKPVGRIRSANATFSCEATLTAPPLRVYSRWPGAAAGTSRTEPWPAGNHISSRPRSAGYRRTPSFVADRWRGHVSQLWVEQRDEPEDAGLVDQCPSDSVPAGYISRSSPPTTIPAAR